MKHNNVSPLVKGCLVEGHVGEQEHMEECQNASMHLSRYV